MCNDLKILIDKNRDLIRITNSYYKEDAIFFCDYIIIQRVNCLGNLEEIVKKEKDIFDKIESNGYKELNNYFYKIHSLVSTHYLVFDLNLFKGRMYPWSSVYHSKFKYNFDHIAGDKTASYPQTFMQIIEDILNKKPGGAGGYLFKVKSTYQEFLNNNKVPTWSSHQNESSWDNSFSKFTKCSRDLNKVALVLRFDEINYKELLKKNKLEPYYDKVIKNLYLTEGAIVDKQFYTNYLTLAKEALSRVLRKITLIERARLKKEQKQTSLGYVYVLKSIGYPGVYKIGSTYGLPEERAEELSGTNVPDPWTVTSQINIKDAEYYEKQIHKLLKNFRYRKGREFFKLDLKIVKRCLKEIYQYSNKGEKKINFKELEKVIKID